MSNSSEIQAWHQMAVRRFHALMAGTEDVRELSQALENMVGINPLMSFAMEESESSDQSDQGGSLDENTHYWTMCK